MQFIQTRNYTTKIDKIFLNNAIYLSIKISKFLFIVSSNKLGPSYAYAWVNFS